jgi:hypothetical protein
MSRYSHQRLDYSDVAPGLIMAGAEIGWVRSSGEPRRGGRGRLRRSVKLGRRSR